MIKILDMSQQVEGNICSSFFKISIVYEYYGKVLNDFKNNNV